jgi:hypothetical protein
MQIVNESDRDVTWWCYNSDDWAESTPRQGGGAIWHREGGPHLTRRTTPRVCTTWCSRTKAAV